MTRVVLSGDRHGFSPFRINSVLQRLYDSYPQLTLIEGCAPGVDHQVESWALSKGAVQTWGRVDVDRLIRTDRLVLEHWPALWKVHEACYCGPGKETCNFAGHRRNLEMAKSGDVEAVVTFHEYIANSKGTRRMAEIAQEEDIKVLFIGSSL